MPNDQEPKGAEQPPLDPAKLLRQIESLIQDKSCDVGSDKTQPARVSKSWIWSIVLPIIVLIGIAVFAWISWRRGRELAKLRHEKNKAQILADNAKVTAEVEKNDAKIVRAEKNFEKKRDELRIIEADIKAEEARYEADRRAIDRMRTWDGSYRRGS